MSMTPDETDAAQENALSGLDAPREAAFALARLGLEKKALDVVVLDIRGQSSYADFIVLMTAKSDPQLLAIADHLESSLKKQGRRPMSVEGIRGGQWVLLDYGDVVVHVFEGDARSFYDLEGLWADAKREEVADEAAQH